MRNKTVVVVILLILSLAGAALIVARAKRAGASQGFTLYMKTTDFTADGRIIPGQTQIRYHKADGSWKAETTYPTGRVDILYGQIGRGVYHFD
jgi:hypothetical protein